MSAACAKARVVAVAVIAVSPVLRAVCVNTWCLRFLSGYFADLVDLFGMLLAATDIALARAVSLLCVELLPVFTDVLIVYRLIVMVRLSVVWVRFAG